MNKHTPSEPMSPRGARNCAARGSARCATTTCIRFTTSTRVQAWALNRYVYQAAIPRKDSSLNCDVHRATSNVRFTSIPLKKPSSIRSGGKLVGFREGWARVFWTALGR